jgi:hypothetical protein
MVTPPYNADFDGDEMNMHVPQSVTTSTEIEILAGVSRHILTPREHKLIIGVIAGRRVGTFSSRNRTCASTIDVLQPALPLHHPRRRAARWPTERPTGARRSPITAAAPHRQRQDDRQGGVLEKSSIDRAVPEAVHGRPAGVTTTTAPGHPAGQHAQNLACDWLMQNGGYSVASGTSFTSRRPATERRRSSRRAREPAVQRSSVRTLQHQRLGGRVQRDPEHPLPGP